MWAAVRLMCSPPQGLHAHATETVVRRTETLTMITYLGEGMSATELIDAS
jgi:hypothetical protein